MWLQVTPVDPTRSFAFPPIPSRISRHNRRVCSCKAAVALEKLLLSGVSGPEGIWGALAADIAAHRDGLPIHLLAWLLVIYAAEEGARVRALTRKASMALRTPAPAARPTMLDLSASLRQSSHSRSMLSFGASSSKRCARRCCDAARFLPQQPLLTALGTATVTHALHVSVPSCRHVAHCGINANGASVKWWLLLQSNTCSRNPI